MTTTEEIAARYRHFAEHEARGESPTYETWALRVADSQEILGRLTTLTISEQQPNRFFAAARWFGVPSGDYDALAHAVHNNWTALARVISARTTQTNEVGRCAVLLPLLASITGPIALLEVGASAGLCLYPDRYSYRYSNGLTLDPATGPSCVILHCKVSGPVPLPSMLPDVVWRAGIDLNPLDFRDADAMRWLETLVWPDQTARLARLRAAIELATSDPPRIERGDLNEKLTALASQAPAEATLVVFHSAVLNYVSDAADRRRFVRTVTSLPGHWISNEGRQILDIAVPESAPLTPATLFTVAFDGIAVALANGHGNAMTWLTRKRS
jgi:hypothetical protein